MHSYAHLEKDYFLINNFQTLKLDFPWQPCLEVASLPEAQLWSAVIQVIWEDANGPKFRTKRTISRRWFFTEQFKELSEHLGLNISAIRDTLYNRWRKQ